jgi:enterochelin esterase-like enzyme
LEGGRWRWRRGLRNLIRIRISQGLHAYLKEHDVPHIWHVDKHAHDFQHWKKALFNFAQLVFKPEGK